MLIYGQTLTRCRRGIGEGKGTMFDSWPRDKLVAVALLIAAMTPDSKASLARTRREDLLPDHSGIADFIRQHFGLWDGNTALIESCGCNSPDNAVMLIIEMTWNALRTHAE